MNFPEGVGNGNRRSLDIPRKVVLSMWRQPRDRLLLFFTSFAPFKGFKRVRMSIVPKRVGFMVKKTVLDDVPFRVPMLF